jgi:hypothetical protein
MEVVEGIWCRRGYGAGGDMVQEGIWCRRGYGAGGDMVQDTTSNRLVLAGSENKFGRAQVVRLARLLRIRGRRGCLECGGLAGERLAVVAPRISGSGRRGRRTFGVKGYPGEIGAVACAKIAGNTTAALGARGVARVVRTMSENPLARLCGGKDDWLYFLAGRQRKRNLALIWLKVRFCLLDRNR